MQLGGELATCLEGWVAAVVSFLSLVLLDLDGSKGRIAAVRCPVDCRVTLPPHVGSEETTRGGSRAAVLVGRGSHAGESA